MKVHRHWWKFGIVIMAMTVLSGCSVLHSELGEILDEKNSFSEYWQWKYPATKPETGTDTWAETKNRPRIPYFIVPLFQR